MKFSLSWLKELVDIKLPLNKLVEILNNKSFEVEAVQSAPSFQKNIFVGEILAYEKHPNADRLRIVKVRLGDKVIEPVVCGATNFEIGNKIVFAFPGARVRDSHNPGSEVTLQKAKIRGIESQGMILSEFELGTGADHSGILVLPDLAQSGTPFDGVEKIISGVFLELEPVATNRSDVFSHFGFAREISTLTGGKLKTNLPVSKLQFKKTGSEFKITVKDTKLCGGYLGVLLKGVKVGPSPAWIKTRLEELGVKSVNNVVDITNFVMLEIGNPLHAFDFTKLQGGKIVIRKAKKGETIITLDNEQKVLTSEMLVVADEKKPLAIAGIIGGKDTGIEDNTITVLLEAATFDGISVRSTARSLGLKTEASIRFMKNLPVDLAEVAAQRAVDLLSQYADAQVAEAVETRTIPRKIQIIELDTSYACNLLGTVLREPIVKKLLLSSGFQVTAGRSGKLLIQVPSYRTDIRIPEDVVEEIGRLFGYDNVPAVAPAISPQARPKEGKIEWLESVKDYLAGAGFSETRNYSFVSLKDLQTLNIDPRECVPIANPMNEEQAFLRPTLFSNLIKTLNLNLKYFDTSKIFEIGKIFKEAHDANPTEEMMLAGVLTMKNAGANEVFRIAKGVLEEFSDKFLAKPFTFLPGPKLRGTIFSASALCTVEKHTIIGELGVLQPEICRSYDIKFPVVYFTLKANELYSKKLAAMPFRNVSRYPRIVYDISAILEKKYSWAEMNSAIRKVSGELLTDVEVFDEYEGKNVPAGKRSLAFHLIFQSQKTTLREEEAKPIYQKIIQLLVSQFEAEIRSSQLIK